MLKTTSVQFAYNDSASFSFPDISLDDGEHLLVIGESGIGKTTLLHLLAGLLRPSTGSIEFNGIDIQNLKEAALDRFRGQNIGIIFQRPHFIQSLTIKENLKMVRHLAGLNKDAAFINELASQLDIAHQLNKKAQNLSQGQMQRAAVAMALINSPQLVLADEPTSSLDDKNCERVAELLKSQAKATEAQLIVITHDQRLKRYFSRSLEL